MADAPMYLVIGFIPDNDDWKPGRGVHTPLRQDGYYGGPPVGVADDWRKNPIHPQERIAIVQVISDSEFGGDNGL
jgi:hypothetical protein